MPRDVHTIDSVARRFGRSPRTIRDWIDKGCVTPRGRVRLQAARVGRRWLVRTEWLEVFEARVMRPFERPDAELGDEGPDPDA